MSNNSKLARLRGELDGLDNEILNLVERRLTLCRRIALSKRNSPYLKLNPERQRAVVERLQARASSGAAPAVAHIWRELMAHGVQVQAPMRFLVPNHLDRDLLVRLVRDQYGSAAPVEWVGSHADAIARARTENVVAVLPGATNPALPEGLSPFDLLRGERGRIVARLIGRIDNNISVPRSGLGRATLAWKPSSWRAFEARQQPQYPDPAELNHVERRLTARAPLVELHDVERLKRRLADAAKGRAILIQGGDCVETFREYSPEKVHLTADVLLELGKAIATAADRPIVHVGRIAGQFAKPRSAATELVAGAELPVYRGDGVNGAEPTLTARIPDPKRLLQAHDQAAATIRHLWDRTLVDSEPIYVSHEALLLNVEQAITHYDELTGRWWAGSGHMLWIGDRTRQAHGAHVEYARGIANPIGLKCGPTLDREELLRLVDRLDPDNVPGRLTLIARMGRHRIAKRLPPLLRATQKEGRNVLWCIDPMHGNTRVIRGRKTRLFADIAAETVAFHEIALAESVWPGGLHLELTGTEVAECAGGKRNVIRLDDEQRYRSGCDPRLNPAQARELAEIVAAWHVSVSPGLRVGR